MAIESDKRDVGTAAGAKRTDQRWKHFRDAAKLRKGGGA